MVAGRVRIPAERGEDPLAKLSLVLVVEVMEPAVRIEETLDRGPVRALRHDLQSGRDVLLDGLFGGYRRGNPQTLPDFAGILLAK
jgi:hypothetical protein